MLMTILYDIKTMYVSVIYSRVCFAQGLRFVDSVKKGISNIHKAESEGSRLLQ